MCVVCVSEGNASGCRWYSLPLVCPHQWRAAAHMGPGRALWSSLSCGPGPTVPGRAAVQRCAACSPCCCSTGLHLLFVPFRCSFHPLSSITLCTLFHPSSCIIFQTTMVVRSSKTCCNSCFLPILCHLPSLHKHMSFAPPMSLLPCDSCLTSQQGPSARSVCNQDLCV